MPEFCLLLPLASRSGARYCHRATFCIVLPPPSCCSLLAPVLRRSATTNQRVPHSAKPPRVADSCAASSSPCASVSTFSATVI
ncbi:hypothetical protein PIB30_035655 [Stylosanthes scabra]|uniref:Secreted protein n=1 Tax=Stylosanthes scabra TaxID=79078 RepID=A0ABU6RDV6_9FABA|nr:hypothetical protein [Stylosanthes scabra]